MSFKSLELFIDGASKGNPGPAGVGVVICLNGEVIKNLSRSIGNTTNNVAEYYALIFGLEEALILRAGEVVVNTDSELLARQLNGAYKVKNASLKLLFVQIQHLASAFHKIEIRQIPRERNRGADKLASQGIKKGQAETATPTFLRGGGKSELQRAA